MERNLSSCPHCARNGRVKSLEPSTRNTPLVSRSDSKTYHLYLEESILHSEAGNRSSPVEVWALFRFDLDLKGLKAESVGVIIPRADNDSEEIEKAADLIATLLGQGRVPQSHYRLAGGCLVEA